MIREQQNAPRHPPQPLRKTKNCVERFRRTRPRLNQDIWQTARPLSQWPWRMERKEAETLRLHYHIHEDAWLLNCRVQIKNYRMLAKIKKRGGGGGGGFKKGQPQGGWVERGKWGECGIATPPGNRIILWANGPSLCAGGHFPVTPSCVLLCNVCDWFLPWP